MVEELTRSIVRLATNFSILSQRNGEWYMAEILTAAAQGIPTIKLYFDSPNERLEAELKLIQYGFNVEPRPFNSLEVRW